MRGAGYGSIVQPARKGKSLWESPYKIITRINDVVYRMQKTPRSRMMVVHLGRLAPYQGVARGERLQRGSGCSGWRTNNRKERNTETEKDVASTDLERRKM
jgi:hypothetical protein